MLESLQKIVKETGKELLKWSKQNFKVEEKGVFYDLVTELDYKTQDMLIKKISALYPNSEFLCEELGYDKKPEKNNYFIIDPIDGTVNFSRGLPEYCISLAYVVNNKPEIGIIYAPKMNLIFVAKNNKGIEINGKKVKPKWEKNLKSSMITMGCTRGKTDEYVKILEKNVMKVRMMGTAALQIAYCSAGYTDAFLSMKSNPWDVAAGYLLLKEAGGKVIKFDGSEASIFDSKSIYVNPFIADKLLNIVKEW